MQAGYRKVKFLDYLKTYGQSYALYIFRILWICECLVVLSQSTEQANLLMLRFGDLEVLVITLHQIRHSGVNSRDRNV